MTWTRQALPQRMIQTLTRLGRSGTGRFVYRKRLPREFGGQKIYVTSRADIRLLAPGFHRSAADLLMISERYAKPGACIWDLGSNLGIFAFCCANRTGRHGHVYSLEADPRYADIQNRTAMTLKPEASAVTILCAAIADQNTVLDLMIPMKGHARNHLSVVSGNQAGKIAGRKQVVTVTGDFLMTHWRKPDLVKIDVEGAELLALRGASSILEARPLIYIEVARENVALVTDLFMNHRYDLYSLSADGSEQPIDKCRFNTLAKPRT